jgi:general secretion pathway protein G
LRRATALARGSSAITMESRSTSRLRKLAVATSSVRRPRGFTLLELLVVIVIIGLLAGIVVPRYFDTVGKSKAKVARAQMNQIEKVLEQYRLDVGSLPSASHGLDALLSAPAGVQNWQGPYMKKAVPPDPWGHPYIYKLSASGSDPDIVSYGADGQPGGTGEAADISLSAPN